MKKFKMLFTALVVFGLTLGMASMASAVSITCGQCHGVTNGPDNADNCNNNARGLHGTHVNYSSATYKKTLVGGPQVKCSYCHSAVLDTKGIASTTHNNNYLNITAYTGVNFNSTGLKDVSRSCTNACHKAQGAGSAPWGNFTTSSVKLSCAACHDDSSNIATTILSGNHKNHLLANTTTPSTYGLMSAGSNAGCNNCHKNNANDFWTAANRLDNGTRKAYPHAIDGTYVQSSAVGTNGMAGNLPTINGGSGNTATCSTNACHSRVTTVQWGAATIDCNMCHYYALSPLDTDNNSIVAGQLSAGHNPHFKSVNRLACNNCHPDHTAETTKLAAGHASKLPAVVGKAAILATLSYTGGTSGTCSNTGGFCHGAGVTPAFGTTGAGCGACHYYPGAPSGRDNWSTGNGHNVRYNTTITNKHMRENAYFHYSSASETFAAVTADKDKCGLCHRNVKIHKNGTNFAHLSSWSGSTYSQCGATPFTFTVGGVGSGSGDNAKCDNVKCHSGKQTPVWW